MATGDAASACPGLPETSGLRPGAELPQALAVWRGSGEMPAAGSLLPEGRQLYSERSWAAGQQGHPSSPRGHWEATCVGEVPAAPCGSDAYVCVADRLFIHSFSVCSFTYSFL